MHCIKKGVNHIVFVQIEDERTRQIQLNLLKSNVSNLLKDLKSGFYRYYIGDNKDRLVPLDTEYNTNEFTKLKIQYSSWHESCLKDDTIWEIKRIKYLELRQYISSIHKKNKSAIIDVTSIKKVYIGDIFACCLLENFGNLCTFELVGKPNYDKPWKTLIHELEEGKDYQYANLVETLIFKDSAKAILIRTVPLLISILGTVLFVSLTLTAVFFFGFSSLFAQAVSIIGTVLGIISFFLIYFPIRGK